MTILTSSNAGSCFIGDSEPIEFPCKFPIKIMGLKRDGFAETVAEIISRHDSTFDPASLQMLPSSKGKYLAFTAIITAVSREQLDGIYMELTSNPMVRIVL